jgi:phage terminase large subunit-like protein
MHRTITTLQQAGLAIEPFPQTQPNLTLATETLYSYLANDRIRLYEAADLRQHVLNVASVETSRGFRLAKEKASLKIDGAVALSFACVAASQVGKPAVLPAGVKFGQSLQTHWMFDPRRMWD